MQHYFSLQSIFKENSFEHVLFIFLLFFVFVCSCVNNDFVLMSNLKSIIKKSFYSFVSFYVFHQFMFTIDIFHFTSFFSVLLLDSTFKFYGPRLRISRYIYMTCIFKLRILEKFIFTKRQLRLLSYFWDFI